MDAPYNHIFFPTSINELFSSWNRFPNAVIYAGGTNIISKQERNVLNLPNAILCLDKIQDLHNITRTEHHLEIGSMVKMNRLLRLGKIVPQALCTCLENIGGVQLRNLATVGGNICCHNFLLDLSALFNALDAQYELRSADASRWVSAARFHSIEDSHEYSAQHASLKTHEILTRIRLPLHRWDFSMYKKFKSENTLQSKILIFLARTQKNTLQDLRIVFKGNTILRNKNAESILIGKHLPITHKTAVEFIEYWKSFLNENTIFDKFTNHEIVNCIEIYLANLSE